MGPLENRLESKVQKEDSCPACVAGVQRGGRGKLGSPYEIPTIALRAETRRTLVSLCARIQLTPPSPLYTGHTG